MGHKKRNIASRSRALQPPSVATAPVGGTTPSVADISVVNSPPGNFPNPGTRFPQSDILNLEGDGVSATISSSSYASIKIECERALTALRRGNHTKALRLMKELCLKNENSLYSALIHRVQGTVCVKVASIIDDPNAKQRHLKNAIESARRAASLSPNSIEFSHFYANLLYDTSNEGKDYEDVVIECERALSIENPLDPAKESLQEENQQKIPTPEARVAHVQNELRSLVQKSNIASISTWMKTLGNGEEKFRLIPIRRIPEDPMELRLVQTRRPNEIKKSTKTPEERRKEIEVRVAAARLLQHKSESPLSQSEMGSVNNISKGLDSASGSDQRAGERRKSGNTRKNASSAERRDWVQSYWNSMSLSKKKDLLRIKISDLKTHFSSLKDGSPCEVLDEALLFGEINKTWKFWICCRCNEKFAVDGLFMQHVVHQHMGSLLPKMQSILPQNVEIDWAEMLMNSPWKPLELKVAIRTLEKQSKTEFSEFLDDSYLRNGTECFVDTYCNEFELDSSSGRKKSGDNCDYNFPDNRKYEDVEWMNCDGNQNCKKNLLHERWSFSDDHERTKLLERIRSVFQTLIRNKCLAQCHLSKVMHFALDELRNLSCASQLLNAKVDQNPSCICFLGALELKKILTFLQEILNSCGLGRFSDKNNTVDDLVVGVQGVEEIAEKISFSQDTSSLVLDEDSLPCKIGRLSCDDASSGDNSPTDILLDPEALLSWIFAGPSSSEQLVSWRHAREEKIQQGLEIIQLLEKEFYHLQSLCERKHEHLSYEESLQAVEDLCLEEGKKRAKVVDFVRRSYEFVLKKRQEELIEIFNDSIISNRFELDAITNVLKDAESLNNNQYSFEETYRGMASHLWDIESGEDDAWRTKDHMRQLDSCIEVAIQRQKEQVSIEISKIDARIMRSVAGMQQLEIKLELASILDFRSILLPLLKSFMRAFLEDLAEKDATEKSDAAREAFLAELDLDSKRSIGVVGVDILKNVNERTKDKKKSKEIRKNKDLKAANFEDLNDQNSEEILLSNARGEVGPESEIDNLEIDDAFRLQEENKRRIEIEAEERKLEETLEYQRQIENDAKQKHLAEQHKILKTNKKAELNPKADHSRLKIEDRDGVMSGSPNGGITPDGLFSDRRPGRRGRRHKATEKANNGIHPPLTAEKEDSVATQVKSGQQNLDDGENGAKTLSQLQAEDDEERFQADLQKAVRQSLDTFNANKKLPAVSSSVIPQIELPQPRYSPFSDELVTDDANGMNSYGTGLTNEVGEYNCFLNVIIQSLWHLRHFRDEFVRRASSEHFHVGDPCVICALYEIFIALSDASTENRREPVTPTSLRVALSNLYPDSNFYQEGQMNDASEVLGVIFNCLHRSFTPKSCTSDTESVDSNCTGLWDCTNVSCIAHTMFGMDIFERMNCYNCRLESRHLKYSSFFHNINASALRTMKIMCPENSFVELLNLVEMNHQLACDPEVGGCGKLNHIHHILSTPPLVFTIVMGWQNTCESMEDIAATFSALSPEADISILYRGLDPQNTHRLVSVVCYYGQHYHCFAYSNDHEQWIMYDDKTVKVIGGWSDVITMCIKGHLQPQLLLFEAVN